MVKLCGILALSLQLSSFPPHFLVYLLLFFCFSSSFFYLSLHSTLYSKVLQLCLPLSQSRTSWQASTSPGRWMFTSDYWHCCIHINKCTCNSAGPGCCFLEDSYGYLVSTVENIYSDIHVKNGKLRQRLRHANYLLIINNKRAKTTWLTTTNLTLWN